MKEFETEYYCVKCGNDNQDLFALKYCAPHSYATVDNPAGPVGPEHLEVRCMRCHFTWSMSPKNC